MDTVCVCQCDARWLPWVCKRFVCLPLNRERTAVMDEPPNVAAPPVAPGITPEPVVSSKPSYDSDDEDHPAVRSSLMIDWTQGASALGTTRISTGLHIGIPSIRLAAGAGMLVSPVNALVRQPTAKGKAGKRGASRGGSRPSGADGSVGGDGAGTASGPAVSSTAMLMSGVSGAGTPGVVQTEDSVMQILQVRCVWRPLPRPS
jgi:hypothetical protein